MTPKPEAVSAEEMLHPYPYDYAHDTRMYREEDMIKALNDFARQKCRELAEKIQKEAEHPHRTVCLLSPSEINTVTEIFISQIK